MKLSSKDFNTYTHYYNNNSTYLIEDIDHFVKRTYQLLIESLIAGAVGAHVGMGFINNMINHISGELTFTYWYGVIVEFILLFGLFAAKKKTPLNLVLLFAFTFMTGFTLAPLLEFFLKNNSGYIISETFGLTAIVFLSLIIFFTNTKRSFITIGKILFIILIVLIVAGIANIFLHLNLPQLMIASISAILFSIFILYDTQNIIKKNISNEIEAAITLYFDFFIFVSFLQILGFLNNEK